MKNLDQLAVEIREVNGKNGWNPIQPPDWDETYRIPAALALVHTEVSEATEAFRNRDVENFKEEMADVLIRVLDLVGGLTFDFQQVVEAKIEKNKGRGFRHGGKRV